MGMDEIKNKRITRDTIYKIASLIYDHYGHINDLYLDYKDVTANYNDPRGDVVRPFVVRSRPSFSIDVSMENQTETISDLDTLKDYLDNKSKKINRISISFYSSYYADTTYNSFEHTRNISEDVHITFNEDHVYTKFNFENNQIAYSDLRSKVENLLNNSPVSYDKIISNKYFRKNIPSLSIGLLLGLVATVMLSIYAKQDNVHELILKLVEYKFFVPIMLGTSIFIGLVIPGKNHVLYNAMNIKRKFVGWTRSSGDIYKDDIKSFVNNSEVEIGHFYNRGRLREEIEKTYEKSKKIVLLELIVFVVLYFVL